VPKVQPTDQFSLYTNCRKDSWFWVYLWPNLAIMRRKNPEGGMRGKHAFTLPNENKIGKLGEVHFALSSFTIPVISHELNHAVFEVMRLNSIDPKDWDGEEYHCEIQQFMLEQVCHRYNINQVHKLIS